MISDTDNGFCAGFGRREITPEKKYPLAGFALRSAEFRGIHDPLYASAVVFGFDGKLAALISLDLLGAAQYLCDEIKKRVAALDTAPDFVSVSAIHTHAAPQSVFSLFRCFDAAYLSFIADSAAECVADAIDDLAHASAAFVCADSAATASLRDRARGQSEYAMPISALLLSRVGRRDILLNFFACHPTVLDERNLFVSRDLVWGCDTALCGLLCDTDTIFFNGACADVSTRYTRQSSDFDEARRLGGIWADNIARALKTARGFEPELKFASLRIKMPSAPYFGEEERGEVLKYLEKRIAECSDDAQKREYISCRSVLQSENYGKRRAGDADIAALTLGGATLFFLPFEAPHGDGLRICSATPNSVCVCYTNGYEGYLPSGRPLDRDSGYEDMESVYRCDASDIVAAAALDAYNAMR